MSWYWILKDKNVIPVSDCLEWGRWFETGNRRVDHSFICGLVVSTVFLGIDHNHLAQLYGENSAPDLFETMIFGRNKQLNEFTARCATYEQAERQHKAVVRLIRRSFGRWRWLFAPIDWYLTTERRMIVRDFPGQAW